VLCADSDGVGAGKVVHSAFAVTDAEVADEGQEPTAPHTATATQRRSGRRHLKESDCTCVMAGPDEGKRPPDDGEGVAIALPIDDGSSAAAAFR
jgi:hypothetical protein